VVVEVWVDLMMTTEVPDVLGMLVDMLSLVEIHTAIHDMLTRARAMSVQGVVEVVALLDRKMGRKIGALRKGSSLLRIRTTVWDPRRVMRSASRR
jgi:hypothetical protein